MTQTERAKFVEHFFTTECVALLNTKGKEYSQHEVDVNSNFKRLGSELELDPKKVLFVYMKKHWDAITSYIKTGKVESEAIEKRIADAINYLFILASLIKEENMPIADMSNFTRHHLECKMDLDHKGYCMDSLGTRLK